LPSKSNPDSHHLRDPEVSADRIGRFWHTLTELWDGLEIRGTKALKNWIDRVLYKLPETAMTL